MNRRRLILAALLISLSVAVFFELRHGGVEHEAGAAKTPGTRAATGALPSTAQTGDGSARRSRRAQSSGGPSPVQTLPDKLWHLVQEFEAQGEFLGRPEGFTNDDLASARAEILPLIRELSADEIRALIEFSHDPAAWPLVDNGTDLAGSMLHIEWGRKDPASVVLWLQDKLRVTLSNEDQPAQFSDPFQSLSAYDVGYIFRGWAALDAEAALTAWSEFHNDLIANNHSIPDSEAAEFDKIVRDAILNANVADPIHPSQ